MVPRFLRVAVLPGLAVAALSGGCASHPAPRLELAAARMAIDNAAVAASSGAARDLALAREKLQLAHRLTEARATHEARWLAEQAGVDAELAQATALAERAYREAAQWRESASTLQAVVARVPLAQAPALAR